MSPMGLGRVKTQSRADRERRSYSSSEALAVKRASEPNCRYDPRSKFRCVSEIYSFHTARVIFGSPGAQLGRPLYPQEQTSPAGPVRSEKCQEATSRLAIVQSKPPTEATLFVAQITIEAFHDPFFAALFGWKADSPAPLAQIILFHRHAIIF